MSSLVADAILVTGAGRRVGLHLAERLLAAGHPVIAHSHQESTTIDELRAKGALSVISDLTNDHALPDLIHEVKSRVQSLRAIVHNASIFENTSDKLDGAIAQFHRMLAIHAIAPFYLNTSLYPLLLECSTEHSDIVHITDIYADNPNYRFDLYCASKAASQNLALSFAKKFAPKVKVNIIQPGPILFQDWHGKALRSQILSETLLKKEGGVESIGLAVEAVLANHYQTGAIVVVDGGRHIS
jgi:dihydromonapterin reductase / dihydrofolate reductase